MLRSFWVIFASSVLTFLASLIAILSGLINPYSEFSNGVIRFWAKGLLRISGIKLEIVGREKLIPGQSYVYISNHQGTFDILACALSIPGTVRFIAKKELFRIPIFAQAIKFIGMIEIDRSNTSQAKESLNLAINRIKEGVSVIVFPEGTRSRDGNIQPFKKGGFVLALKGHIPIAPIVISGSFNIMKKKSMRLHKGRIKVEFLDPEMLDHKNYEDRDSIVRDIRQKIIDHFNPHYGKE